MSRSTRHDIVLPTHKRKASKREQAVFLAREIKRRLIKGGIIADPTEKPAKWDYHWASALDRGVVEANTCGEARSLIKQYLNVKNLPIGIEIVRVEPSADSTSRLAASANSPTAG